MLTVLHVLAAVVGSAAFYALLFMYENAQRKWQNRIDLLWAKIDDRAKLTGSRASAFFNQVSIVVNRVFDRMFGPRLFSLRAVGTSSCYSLAGLFFSGWLGITILLLWNDPANDARERLMKYWLLLESFSFRSGCIFLVLALLPSFFSSRWFVRLSLVPVFFFWFIGLPGELIHGPLGPHGSHPHYQLIMSSVLLASFLSDVFFVALVRLSIRWITAKAITYRILVAALVQASVVYFLIFVPFGVGTMLEEEFGRNSARAVRLFALLNVFAGLTACTLLFAMLFALLHKVFWPVLARVFYALARYDTMRNRKVLASIVIVCYTFAFPVIPKTLKIILELLK